MRFVGTGAQGCGCAKGVRDRWCAQGANAGLAEGVHLITAVQDYLMLLLTLSGLVFLKLF